MPDSLNEKLRRAGLAHVVVASGFHLGLITGLFRKLFKKVSRFASHFAAILAMLAFVSIAGFSSSMLRASLVTLLGMFVGYRGRKLHPARLLLYAAAITLLYSPTLWLDAAWQLSFASYAGLLFLAPLIQDYFFGKDIGSISSSLIQTISAQLACLPISIYVFGSFSPIGIVSNLLIPPTIPLAMLLCFFTVLFSPISKIGPIIAWLTRRLLGIHVGIVNYLSHFDWASQTVENNNPKVFALYILLILVFLFLKWRSKYSFRPKYGNLTAMEKSRKDVKIYAC